MSRQPGRGASEHFGLHAPLLTFLLRETALILHGPGMWWRRIAYLVVSAGVFVPIMLTRADGRSAFSALMMLNCVAAYSLTTAYFSKSISGQREAGTLEMLRITGLSPLAILVGFGTSLFIRAILFLVAQLPFALFCVPLGGIGYGAILGAYVLAVALLFFLCHAGVYWSVVSKSSRHAGSNSVLTCFLLYVLPSLLLFVGSVRLLGFPAWLNNSLSWLAAQNPRAAFSTLLSGGWPVSSILLHLGFGAAFLRAAVRRFEPTCERHEAKPALAPRPGGLTQKARRRPVPRVHGHPLTWKEFHFAAGGAWGRKQRWLAYLTITALIFYFSGEFAFNLLCVGLGGLFIELPIAWTKIIGAEVQQNTLGDLAILPIPPWRMVWHKLLGHLPILLPAFSLAVAGLALGGIPWRQAAREPLFWALPFYVAWQLGCLFVLTIYLSLTQPVNAYGTSFLGIILWHLFGLGVIQGLLKIPLVILLPISLFASGWLVWILIRAFPTSLARIAAK